MNKADIRKELEQNLSSPTWDLAKNALVGQELISWGTEVIYAVQMQKLAMEDIYNQSNPSMADLIRLSNTLFTPLQLRDPSWIQLSEYQISDTRAEGGTMSTPIQPYRLEASSGSAKFYNIDYFNTGADFYRLYQGSPVVSFYEDSYSLDLWSDISIAKKSITLQEGIDGTSRYRYATLPSTIMIESLRVYVVNASGLSVLHPFDPFEFAVSGTSVDMSYRVMIDENGNYNILFGLGQNTYTHVDSDSLYLEYLDLTNLDYGSSLQVLNRVSGVTSREVPVSYYRSKNFKSRDHVIKDLVAKTLSSTSLTTLSQIERYAETFEHVNSARAIVSSTQGQIDLYMNMDSGFEGYGLVISNDIQNRVSLSITISMKVSAIVPVKITNISYAESLTPGLSTTISNWIIQEFSQQKALYGQQVYKSEILYRVKEEFGVLIVNFDWSYTDSNGDDVPITDSYGNTVNTIHYIASVS